LQFELYVRNKQIDKCHTFRLVMLTNRPEDVYEHIKREPLSSDKCYVILDNSIPYPLNYDELGYDTPPCEADCYTLVYNCKVAKHKILSLPKENFVPFYNSAMELALYETLVFFQENGVAIHPYSI